MAPIDPIETRRLLDEIIATSSGTLLEDLVTELFPAIPGLILRDRDRLSAGGNEELDLAFSNSADPAGWRSLIATYSSSASPKARR